MKPSNQQFKVLSLEARTLYTRLSEQWSIKDAAGLVTLLTACQALDRLREAQALLAKDGPVAPDRFGVPKLHPACQLEKEARAGLLMGLKALNLDLESLELED